MKTLILTFAAAAAAVAMHSDAFAGPGGREPDLRIAPREFPVTGYVMSDRAYSSGGTTIALAVTDERAADPREFVLERRTNARGQFYFIHVAPWMQTQK